MKPYGCHSRALQDSLLVQDGYIPHPRMGAVLLPRYVRIADQSSRDCKHTKEVPSDPRCEGCPHRQALS